MNYGDKKAQEVIASINMGTWGCGLKTVVRNNNDPWKPSFVRAQYVIGLVLMISGEREWEIILTIAYRGCGALRV